MKRLLLILVVALAFLAHWQEGAKTVCVPQEEVSPTMTAQVPRHHEATLTDATSLYRICSPRLQRFVPSHGAKSERSSGESTVLRHKLVKPHFSSYDSRRRLETAPFCLAASCDYYVIALRRIIR